MVEKDPKLTYLSYVDQELAYVHQLWEEFGSKYPESKEILNKDPHSKLLRETLAFLSARVRLKLDDDLPEVADAILGLLYPHLCAPIPSFSLIQMAPPGKGRLTAAHTVPARARIITPPDSQGVRCEFRSCYPVTVMPIDVTSAAYLRSGAGVLANSSARINIELTPHQGIEWKTLDFDRLRVFISGEPTSTPKIYEAIFRYATAVEIRGKDAQGRDVSRVLDGPIRERIRDVGFRKEEGILPYSERSLLSYRVVHEFFVFQSKFLFADFSGLAAIRALGLKGPVTVSIHLNHSDRDLEPLVRKESFQLGVTPAVNLFEKAMEPIRLNQRVYEYVVEPDRRAPESFEVYSVDEVRSIDVESSNVVTYRPFYSLRHGERPDLQRAYWFATRRPRNPRRTEAAKTVDYSGTDVFLSFVNDAFDRMVPPDRESISVRATCTNRARVALAKFGPGTTGLRLEGEPGLEARFVEEPTKPILPPLRGRSFWRLISTLALNQLPISAGAEGRQRLQEILALHDFVASPESRDMVEGLSALQSRASVRRVAYDTGSGLCRGMTLHASFDPNRYKGQSYFLFACVLERFLSSFASINSFVQLESSVDGRDDDHHVFPPRFGERGVL